MTARLDLTIQQASTHPQCPDEGSIRKWITLALAQDPKSAEITVRIVDEEECAELNTQFRNRQGPTNVLAFPYDCTAQDGVDLYGDIVICAPVVARESKEQHKDLQSHWAHMVIHGTLHLMGYDHTEKKDAETMEALECSLMDNLGYNNPYLEQQI